MRVKTLDGLRGIAILLVVWYHLWLQTWMKTDFVFFGRDFNFTFLPATGYIGVEIFLFLTGFGLFYPYAVHIFEEGKLKSLSEFAKKRFLRIIPSYYLALFAALFFFTVESANVKDGLVWQIFTHITFIHLFFEDTQGAVGGVLWTVATIVQFYLIFPVLAWAFVKKPWLTFLVMVLVAYVFREHGLTAKMNMIEMWNRQMPAFLDIFACGMLTAYLLPLVRQKFSKRIRPFLPTAISIVVIIVFVNSLQVLYKTDLSIEWGRFVWLSYNRLGVGLLFLLLSLSLNFSFKFWQKIFDNRVMLFLAAISYNFYLWHGMIILELKARHIPDWAGPDPRQDTAWKIGFIALSLILSLGVSALITYGFEKPIESGKLFTLSGKGIKFIRSKLL